MQHIRTSLPRFSISILALLTVGIASSPSAAAAQLRLDHYRAAPTVEDGFAVERPTAPGHLRPSFDAHLDYALAPLVIQPDDGSPSTPVVEHLVGLQVGASLGLFDRFLVYARLPVALAMEGETFAGFPSSGGGGLSDLVLGARARLYAEEDESFALALSLNAAVPTASAANDGQLFAGEAGVTFSPQIVAEVRPIEWLNVSATVGGRFREAVQLPGLGVGHELTFSLAVGADIVEDLLEARIETWGSSTIEDFGAQATTPWEALLGVRVSPVSGLVLGLAGGLGVGRGVGAPAFRGVFTVGWIAPESEAPEGSARGTEGGGEVDPDWSGAGEARVATEDGASRAGTLTTDGTPRVVAEDAQFAEVPVVVRPGAEPAPLPPHAAERMPVEGPTSRRYALLDRDGDSVRDSVDRCPLDAEDYDEIDDRDGCPEEDADGDGVADVGDRCPLTSGAQAGSACAGCPERACVARGGSIVIGERVEFALGTADIEERSLPVLTDVLSILGTNPQIERVRIEGHTDAAGNDDDNLVLSTARARAITRWLEGRGIEGTRLEAWGCGEAHPIASNERTAGRSRNRRVEFLIIVPSSGQTLREGCTQAQ